MTVHFDESAHTYTVDGVAVPSVTQLCAPLGQDYDEPTDLAESVLDFATDRGVTLHAYIAHRLMGGAQEDFEIPDVYEPWAQAAELFLSEHTIVPMLIETPLGAGGFAGTPDLVCEIDGEFAIVDYKFVSQIAKTKVGAQLHGYKALCEANGIFPEKLYAVQFLSSGDYRLYPIGEDGQSDFALCRRLYEAKHKRHPRGRIA